MKVIAHETKFGGLVVVLNAEFGISGRDRKPSGDAFQLLANALSCVKV
jgi:hypothetical protein